MMNWTSFILVPILSVAAGVPGGEIIPASGAAGRYRAFLSDELIPPVEREYRTQPYRVLCAHSLGGLFAVETVLRAPDLFGGAIVTSPSLWWDGEATAVLARERLRPDAAWRTRLFVTTGNEDDTIQKPVDRLCSVLERLAPKSFAWRRARHGESSHQELPIRAFNDGLDVVFAGWELPPEAMERGIEAVDAHSAGLSEHYGYPIEVPEAVINRLGYRALSARDPELALVLFRRNVERHPESANAHDSLGEALLGIGDVEGARASYERALALDPGSSSARTALERIGATPRP